jgi:hypothetical protein
MELLTKIKNYENKLRLLKLVNAGYKTASVFSVYPLTSEEKDQLIQILSEKFCDTEFYLHPLNDSFLQFYNVEKLNLMHNLYYPEFVTLSRLEIIENRKTLFLNPLEWEIYHGYLFDIPISCIFEFSYEQSKEDRKYIQGFGGEISVYYKSETARLDAINWIKSLENIDC